MDNKKKYLIIGVVVLLVIIIAIIMVTNSRKKGATHTDELKDEDLEYIANNNNIVQKNTDFAKISSIKTCIEIYYRSLICTNPDNIEYLLTSEGDAEFYKNKLMSILSKEYIDANGITKESLEYKSLVTDFKVDVLELYKVSSYEESEYDFNKVELYLAKGIFRNLTDKSGELFEMAIVIDNVNRCFEIYPSDYKNIEKYSKLKPGDKIDFAIPEQLEKNDYNGYSTNYASMDDFARLEFNTITDIVLYDTDKAYELLSEKGKELYSSSSDLAAFRDENKSKLALMNYSSNTLKLNNGELTIDCYDMDYSYKITLVFDEYSTFTFSIEKIK